VQQMTREGIEKKIDELARKYVEKRDPQIIDELYTLRLELERLKSRLDRGQRTAKH
jgi:regulator of replication initiation timing